MNWFQAAGVLNARRRKTDTAAVPMIAGMTRSGERPQSAGAGGSELTGNSTKSRFSAETRMERIATLEKGLALTTFARIAAIRHCSDAENDASNSGDNFTIPLSDRSELFGVVDIGYPPNT